MMPVTVVKWFLFRQVQCSYGGPAAIFKLSLLRNGCPLPTFVIICHVSHVACHHVNEELQERISCQAIELRQKDFELKKTTEDLDRAQAR